MERWKRKDTIISRLAWFWRFFVGFSAGSKTTLPFAYPWTELHQTLFLGLLQAISPELGVGSGNIPVLADYPNFAPWSNFWLFFSGGSKTTLSCAYLWTELHQTLFPGFLQAFPPESSVGNGKTPLLADWPGFGGFLSVFRPAPRRRCPSLTSGPNYTKLGFLCFWRPFHMNRALETERHLQISRFFGQLQDDAVLRLPLDRITPNSISCVFCRPFHLNRALKTERHHH